MIEKVWDYCNRSWENHGYIPSTEEVAESLHHVLTPDEMDDAHNTIHDFISTNDLAGIRIDYTGESTRRLISVKTCACHQRELQEGEVVIQENGFYYCSKQDLIAVIKNNPHHFADMLLDNGVATLKEVM